MPEIYNPDGNIVQQHPAETAMPIATVIAALIGKIAGVEDTDTILYIGLALSFVPILVTWVINRIQDVRKPVAPTTYKGAP